MSNVKKVLTLVACGCICLTVATSASADFLGAKAVTKDDPATQNLCNQANGPNIPFPLSICNLFANFSDPNDRLLSVGDGDMQVFNGANPAPFFQHLFNPVISAPSCFFVQFVAPDLICDTFVTIGYKCAPDPAGTDTTGPDPAFSPGEFGVNGHVVGGWFAVVNDETGFHHGDAGLWPDLEVLWFQSSVADGHTLEGIMTIFWLSPAGETIAEVDQAILCGAKCVEGDSCDDSDPCTGNPDLPEGEQDTCTDGVCTGLPIDCSSLNDACNVGVCVDGGCVAEPTNEGGGCDDSDACTTGDTCAGGACVGGAPPNCDDNNGCTDDGCNSDTGCTHTDNSAGCDDGDACTDGDTCSGGSCQSGPPLDCDDGDACTDDGCDSATGCTHSTTDCDDGNACTDDDCDPATGCFYLTTDCDDLDLCTDDGCNPKSGCTNDQVQCPDGQGCNSDTGVCEDLPCETDEDCDDGNLCTDDICDPGVGCMF
ncbi:MAG: hypothetical protein IID34_16760, partial [Planctomycetes bacterium]|nr:hypothetical protein [Planctomycetota bacterium]